MIVYLTDEGKKELEKLIVEIEGEYFKCKGNDDADEHYFDGARTYLKEIYSMVKPFPKND